MNKKIIVGTLTVCLLVFVAVMAFSQAGSSNVRWEYTTMNAPTSHWGAGAASILSQMNALGEQGWEYVSSHNAQMIFKRRLP